MSQTMIFIDSKVTDYQKLISELSVNAEVHLLNAEQDGVLQIAEIMQNRSGVDSVQIFSHGSDGSLSLGSTVLNNESLSFYQDTLAKIGSSLTPQADLLLYGCNVAQTNAGVQFVENLSRYTGADVAASADLTGAADKGGDWNLEFSTGLVNVPSAAVGLTNYESLLLSSFNQAPSFQMGDGIAVTSLGAFTDLSLSMIQQTDGKYVLAGYTEVASGGEKDFGLLRYQLDGSLDTSFDTDGKVTTNISTLGSGDSVNDLIQQADGKLVVFGNSINTSGNEDASLARYNSNGSLDTGFGNNGIVTTSFNSVNNDSLFSGIQLADGKLMAAGYCNTGTGSGLDFLLARYNADGSLDSSFGSSGKVTTSISTGLTNANDDGANAIIQQSDGKFVLAGYSDDGNAGETMDFSLARYNSDGSLDTGFGNGGKVITAMSAGTGDDRANAVIQQADGKLVVIGNCNDDIGLARYNANGSLDTSFDGDGKVTTNISGNDSGYTVIQQADGKLVVGGSSNNDFVLVRYNANGSIDSSFGTNGVVSTSISSAGTDQGMSLIPQDNGKFVLAGFSNHGTGTGDFAIARYNSDGTLDKLFHPTSSTLGGSIAFTEGGNSVVLDNDVQIFDSELSGANNFNGASLTLARNGGANANDVFSAAAFSGSSVIVSNTSIGSYSQSAGTLTLTFNSSATQALVNQALQQIAYSNTSENPPASAQINWTFTDGNTSSALSTTGSTTVNITSVNDAPSLGAVTANNVLQTNAGQTSYSFQVAYLDVDDGINAATIDINDISVRKGSTPLTVTSAVWDAITQKATYTVIPPGGSWNDADNGNYSIEVLTSQVADNSGAFVAGNSNAGIFSVSMDTTAPTALTLFLNSDTGSSNSDNITNDNLVNVTGLEVGTTWQYSLNSGTTWNIGTGTSFSLNSDTSYPIGTIQVRQIDSAGNISIVSSNSLLIKADSTAPSNVVGSLSIAENAANGAYVGTVTATDVNPVTYFLTTNANGRFAIDTNTGVVTVADATKIDYETATSHNINVRVTDLAGNVSETLLPVSITDVNEIVGTPNDDSIEGGLTDDEINAGAGSDTSAGSDGNDTINGGDGADSLDGADGNDNLNGGADNDTLLGGIGADTLTGVAGNDVLNGGSGNDSLDGGDGDDNIDGSDGNDTLIGSNGADTLIGGIGDDILNGDSGNDSLEGGSGNDSLDGGDDNDTLFGDNGADTLFGGAGDDVLNGGNGNDSLDGGDDNDRLDGGADNDILFGGNGTDTLLGREGDDILNGDSGNDNLNGGDGDDKLDGSDGNDTLIGGNGADTLIGGAGDDMLNGEDGNDSIEGGDDNDKLDGGNDNDILFGGNGVDTLIGGAGADLLSGDNENDNLKGDDGGDTLYGGRGKDKLDGGNGNDSLSGDNNVDTLHGGAGNDLINGGLANDKLYGDKGKDNLNGGDDNDSLFGGNNIDTLQGADGDDVLNGGEGNDKLYGDKGKDNLNGGDGDDNLSGGNKVDTLIGATGNDVLKGDQGNDNLYGDDGEDTLDGGTDNDKLYAGNGDDVLIGKAGAKDYLEGGGGNDSYFVGQETDVVVETSSLDTEIDSISSWANYALPDNVENLILKDMAETGKGNELQNSLVGNKADNTLIGAGNADTLSGKAGEDILHGGSGDDMLTGGADSDFLIGGIGKDYFYFNSTNGMDIIKIFSSANDTIQLESSVFSKLGTPGPLPTENFAVDNPADTDDYLIYKPGSGELLYDTDGNGAVEAEQIALIGLTNHPNLSATDFVIV